MINNLSNYLKREMLDDYWYDSALFVCEDILKGFSDDEWKELLEAIPNENIEWKKRLVECLGGLESPYEMDCIIEIITTDDEDLFVACIDSLRSIDTSTMDESIRKDIIKQVEKVIEENSSSPVKKVLEEFLSVIA